MMGMMGLDRPVQQCTAEQTGDSTVSDLPVYLVALENTMTRLLQ